MFPVIVSKEEQSGLKSPLWKGDTHQGSPLVTDKGMAPQTQQLEVLWKFAYKWAQDRNTSSRVCSPRRVVILKRNSRVICSSSILGLWSSMEDESALQGFSWVSVGGPVSLSSTAVLSRVWWVQGVMPATVTAVGVVSTVVYGPLQVGVTVCCFQSLAKSPGDYGCIVVPKENGILSWT